MSGSFIDRQRSAPAAPVRMATVHGFDPDQDTVGWASIHTLIPNLTKLPLIITMGLITPAKKHRDDLEQVSATIEALHQGSGCINGCPYVFVEAQQVYPTPDELPSTRVAKANDLLRLAQITGAIQALAHERNARLVRAVLPATWKGQKKKEVTADELAGRYHSDAIIIVHTNKPPQTVPGASLNQLPARLGHALDALGIATYGLDWLSRHTEVLRD